MCQLHWFRLVNFVHGVIASILIYEFVCMCPHVSVTLVSTGQLRPWVIASIVIYQFVCMCPHASVTLVSTGQLCPWGHTDLRVCVYVSSCVSYTGFDWSTSSMG